MGCGATWSTRRWSSTAATPPPPPSAAPSTPPPETTPTPTAAAPDAPKATVAAATTAAPATAKASPAKSGSTPGAANANSPPRASVYTSVYVDEGLRRWKSVEWWQRGLLAGIGICTGVGGVVYLLWDAFSSDATHQTKTVASNVLQDHEMQKAAFMATKNLVQAVLCDDDAVELLVGVVHRLLSQDASRQSVALFLKGIFEDNYTKEVTKLFVLQIVQDQWVRERLLGVATQLTIDVLQDPVVRAATRDFLVDASAAALRDTELHKTGGQALRSTFVEVVNPIGWLGRSSPAPTPAAAPAPPPSPPAAAVTPAPIVPEPVASKLQPVVVAPSTSAAAR